MEFLHKWTTAKPENENEKLQGTQLLYRIWLITSPTISLILKEIICLRNVLIADAGTMTNRDLHVVQVILMPLMLVNLIDNISISNFSTDAFIFFFFFFFFICFNFRRRENHALVPATTSGYAG